MKFKYFIAFLFLSLIFSFLSAQSNDDLNFKHYSTNEGLSQRSVGWIVQDSYGFIWFATRDGLNKYDGYSFTIYRHNTHDSTSLSNSKVTTIFEDTNKNLWVGTRSGLNKYNRENDSFKRYKNIYSGFNSYGQILSIEQKTDDSLWIGTNNGLIEFSIEKQTAISYQHEKDNINSLSNNKIIALLTTKDSNVWISTPTDIDYYNIISNTFKHYSYPKNNSKKTNHTVHSTLYEDSKRNVWLGFEDGLAIFDKKSQTFVPFKLKTGKNFAITSAVRSICEDSLGNLWIATYNGIFLINNEKTKISHYTHKENSPNSLSHNSIYKIIEDTRGDIWIGTWAGGINYYNRSYDNFKKITSGRNNTMLNYNVVSSIVEDKKNNLWIGTEGGGINFLNKKTGTFEYYTHNITNKKSVSDDNVKAMIQDHKGNLWVGTHGGGLNVSNLENTPLRFTTYKNTPGDINSLSNNKINALHEDTQHQIWIGTLGSGINIFNPTTKSFTKIKDSLKHLSNIILTISKSSDKNKLYIGGEKGVSKIDIQTKKISQIKYINNGNPIPFTKQVISVYEDKNKNLWIGTEGDGLYFYNNNTLSITKFGVYQGLPSEVIYGILTDDKENIWISSNNGLSRVNTNTREIKNFDRFDGLQGNEFNYGAYLKKKNGELLFGGTNGLSSFNPKDIIENIFTPKVLITAIHVNNKPFIKVTKAHENSIFNYKQNVINFDFVALSYSQPNKNQYAYKLVGFDNDWNYIGNKRSATYTNLDAGNYTFKVKASNEDGLWNNKGASLKISILPAPWKTWWAYLIYTFLFIVSVLLLIKYSLTRIKEKNLLIQERIEKEKLEEVNHLKLRLFTNISHDFRTPLTLILGPLERLLKTKKENAFVHEQLEIMHRNTKVLLQLINQLLDFRKNESGKLQLHASKEDIIPFIKNVKISFEEHARHRKINYKLLTQYQKKEIWFDKVKLQKILFNLLSNAFKFTPDNGEISININNDSFQKNGVNYLEIKIKDNGKGISKKNIPLIFNRFFQLEEGTHSGTGIGLALTKSLIELHRGTITVNSIEGKETVFSILLPLGNSHLSPEQMKKSELEIETENQFKFEQLDYVTPLDSIKKNDPKINASLPTILLVEDNHEVRVFIKTLFIDNYNIYEAENGEEAIEIAKSKHLDLIISDIMMPVMDGIELCKNIKTNIKTSHIPVILLTARTSSIDHEFGYQTGADVYITKPFDTSIIVLQVSNLLNTRRHLIEKFKTDLVLEPKELTVTSADELFLEKSIAIVEQNMSNPEFNATSFVSEMNMSRSLVYNKLKALTDQSTSEFIRTIKLKKAGKLIQETKLTISEIAFELGFNDIKYFRQCFKKLFNENPSQYRSKKEKDN
ncbi:MAG: two-component regulator propeller domain-containing protein [Cellulophaga sp.]